MPKKTVEAYENLVELKYQLYNGLFLTLPLNAIEQTGLFLPLLEEACVRGLEQGLTPTEILEDFFASHKSKFSEQEQISFLFNVIQYVERQVVLVDALEDAAYDEIHQTAINNQLQKLLDRVNADSLDSQLAQVLDVFSARVILTAHPTQFYPGQVLSIITDLQNAMSQNHIADVRSLLQQLGNTPFFNKIKPTPEDEAIQLTWYLRNIFYPMFGEIVDGIADRVGEGVSVNPKLLSIGFWPGGDRDGNPFVTVDTTLNVAKKLRQLVVECYHSDIREIKRRLSFAVVYDELDSIEQNFHKELSEDNSICYRSPVELIGAVEKIENMVNERYQGLNSELLVSFKRKIKAFGFHFASLDLRQDSRVLSSVLSEIEESHPGLFETNWQDKNEADRISFLLNIQGQADTSLLSTEIAIDTIKSIAAIKTIQCVNGEKGCHRYIISNCSGAYDIAVLTALFRLAGWSSDELTVDLVPLFETVNDLAKAGENMVQLYSLPEYNKHVANRNNKQTVMLGFSDGTKDGGYLMANWAIYQAKEAVTKVSREAGIEVSFFDGRGGPPARGGGNTYKFYAALGKEIESNDIQVTVQGQTISSYYGTHSAAKHNLNQLLAAGLENTLYDRPERQLDEKQRSLIQALADKSLEKYLALKNDPLFLPYLENMSPMHFYGQSNIGSRPSKRGGDSQLKFEDLRAIPFVGAWGQLKQNVPGFYGVGTALKEISQLHSMDELKQFYKTSMFFKALLDNSMQSMKKANFKLTRYMSDHAIYGDFWRGLNEEYELSRKMILEVSGQSDFLEDNPSSRESIGLRQKVVLPLLVIQQYALIKASLDENEQTEMYERMIMRSLFGNINASRNSA